MSQEDRPMTKEELDLRAKYPDLVIAWLAGERRHRAFKQAVKDAAERGIVSTWASTDDGQLHPRDPRLK
jgi:hypothetical protein